MKHVETVTTLPNSKPKCDDDSQTRSRDRRPLFGQTKQKQTRTQGKTWPRTWSNSRFRAPPFDPSTSMSSEAPLFDPSTSTSSEAPQLLPHLGPSPPFFRRCCLGLLLSRSPSCLTADSRFRGLLIIARRLHPPPRQVHGREAIPDAACHWRCTRVCCVFCRVPELGRAVSIGRSLSLGIHRRGASVCIRGRRLFLHFSWDAKATLSPCRTWPEEHPTLRFRTCLRLPRYR